MSVARRLCTTRLGHVHCVSAGTNPSAPLVLLHQTPRSVDEFAELLPLLARERRVIAIDTPGYGCSDRVPGAPTIEDYAGAVVDALDALGVREFVPVGHHTGAVIAFELAACVPERVERAVYSGPVDLDAAGRAYLLPFFRQWQVEPDGSHLVDKWRKFSGWLPDPALVQRLVVDLFRAGEASEQGHFATTVYEMERRAERVRCPALLIYGARDPFAKPERAALHRASFRPAVETTLDAGVFGPNENPAAYADAILGYLRTPTR